MIHLSLQVNGQPSRKRVFLFWLLSESDIWRSGGGRDRVANKFQIFSIQASWNIWRLNVAGSHAEHHATSSDILLFSLSLSRSHILWKVLHSCLHSLRAVGRKGSHKPKADPASKFRGGAILVIFGSQVSLRVHYCRRHEVYFTTLLWQNNGRQNGLISRMLFFELYKIMVKKLLS